MFLLGENMERPMKLWCEGDKLKFSYYELFDRDTWEYDFLDGEVDSAAFKGAFQNLRESGELYIAGKNGSINVAKSASEYHINFSGVGNICSVGIAGFKTIDDVIQYINRCGQTNPVQK